MSGKYDLDRDLYIRRIGMKTKPGMSSLNEDDVRRIFREELHKYETELNAWNLSGSVSGCIARHDAYQQYIDAALQATDTEPPANQATSEVPAAEDNVPPWVERRKRPEPRQYKEPTPCKDNT